MLFNVFAESGTHSGDTWFRYYVTIHRTVVCMVSLTINFFIQIMYLTNCSDNHRILGLVFLIFGFATLIGSMIYCVVICRDAKSPEQLRDSDLYWTRHWSKSIGYTPHEINYISDRDRYNDAHSDKYSVSKISGKYSDVGSARY